MIPLTTLKVKQIESIRRQNQLNAIADSIDTSKLFDQEALPVDKKGRVKIDSESPRL